ncbi:MAG TPA: PD-(D/E)XK nuclease-like domain-containing protein [Candidatus Krumholzibacteria bacterium]|nr:PD-(D/E)XK nuclease-like domain-containing protein [Candidatus Krumholzibacteria bacterium]HPD72857.1 PD-(D/E)XK nuclease-like domain-containing protein [Candidatus Krumholzibacteria bacterium]HRY42093.1 PD-(D/E)XK nuclease-like domain-containing protein [Candidatus Krumholzibacteria bacterium]
MNLPEVFNRRAWSVQDLICEPADVYHAQAGKYLSSHRLAEFRRNPLLFHKKELGLVQDQDRPAYVVGRAAHVLILEGREVYEQTYAFGGPINPKTGQPFGSRTKAFQDWADAQGKPVLDDDQAALIESLGAAVQVHKHASALLADGVPEGVVRAEYCGLPCQSRLDWLNPELGIVDLKTCDNLDWLQTDARAYGYAHQLAFYRSMVASVTATNLPVYMIAVEKREPLRCGVWRISEEVLGLAQKENEEGIARLKDCRQRDEWLTGYEDIRTFDWI